MLPVFMPMPGSLTIGLGIKAGFCVVGNVVKNEGMMYSPETGASNGAGTAVVADVGQRKDSVAAASLDVGARKDSCCLLFPGVKT